MDLDSILAELDQVDQGGPGTTSPSGETSGEIIRKALAVDPGSMSVLVDRYASSDNRSTINNLAANLVDMAEKPQPDTVNLIYTLIERTSIWDYSRAVNNMLIAIRSQTVNGMAWHPPDQTPPVLSRFLNHCIALEPDDENDNSDTAVNILWNLQLWAEDRGGLRSVFNESERQAFRDTFEEVELEPGPILEALGES